MKKIIIFLITMVFLLNTVHGFDGSRTCETKYSVINGVKYFSGLYCTEDIKLTGVVADTPPLRDMSSRVINDFIVINNSKIVDHLKSSGSCDTINDIDEIQGFENVIYSNNGISYDSTTTSVESLTTEIEDLMIEYNSEDLYGITFGEIQTTYPLGSLDFQRVATQEAYFTKQQDIKNQILDKQKEKLTYLYQLTESQKFIESFYKQVTKVCEGYEEKYTNKNSVDSMGSDELETNKEALITKYKEEFNVKLGDKLDSLPRQVLESLSVKLLSYAETSPVFKRFSDAQRDVVKLKITALKQAIDDRLE